MMKPLLSRSNSTPHSHSHHSTSASKSNSQQQPNQQNIVKKSSSKSFRPIAIASPIVTPYHLIHFHHHGVNSSKGQQSVVGGGPNGNNVGVNGGGGVESSEVVSGVSSGGGSSSGGGGGAGDRGGQGGGGTGHGHGFNVTGWLVRRGSVPEQSSRQGASWQSHDAAGLGSQSRPPVGNRKGSVVTQQDDVGKQRLDGRKAATSHTSAGVAATTSNGNATATVNATSKEEYLLKARRHRAAMEEISQSIQRLESSANQQIIQLTDTYGSVIGKLEELQIMTTRFAELQKMTTELVDNFTTKEEEFVMDMEGHIKTVGAYQEEVAAIRVLQRRLDLQRRAVENYKTRLETVEERISRQKELEVVWRQRASRRLRIIWGMISVLVILWLLATSTQDNYLVGIDEVDEGDEPPPEQQFMEDALGVKFEYGSLPKEVLSLEAERLLRERHQHDEP